MPSSATLLNMQAQGLNVRTSQDSLEYQSRSSCDSGFAGSHGRGALLPGSSSSSSNGDGSGGSKSSGSGSTASLVIIAGYQPWAGSDPSRSPVFHRTIHNL